VLGLSAHVECQVAFGEHHQHVVDPPIGEQVRVGIAVDEMTHTDDRFVAPAVECPCGGNRIEEW
jgi:hypothetical protein